MGRIGIKQGSLGLWLVIAIAALLPSAASAAPPTPFGHDCAPQDGVLFCPTTDLGDRIPSFDGAPLDVDVTLPAGTEAGTPLPTIVMLHGFGGDKTDFETSSPEGEDPEESSILFHWNNNFFAKQGYAVVNYTVRGFGRSCGKAGGSAATPECLSTKSYLHLIDQRWEVRDTQYLLGLLADQGITTPDQIGATGISYGGGQSIQLAYLRNRMRQMDDSLVPWTSPNGTSMEISAAYPRWLWSDLADALVPNGRFRDSSVATQTESLDPIGVPILSYVSGLFALGTATGTYCGTPPRVPPCTDPTADVPSAFADVLAGEPYSATAADFLAELHDFHSAIGLFDEPGSKPPAPLMLESGWTDDLFPPEQSIRAYNQLRADDPNFPVEMVFGDLGHSRGHNKVISDQAFNDQAAAFFATYVKGEGAGGPQPGRVTAYTQTCPADAPTNGPFVGSSYDELAEGSLGFSEDGSQSVLSTGGNPSTGVTIDPIAGEGSCARVDDQDPPGTAIVRGPVSRGYTVLGLPTVTATVNTTGVFGQLDSRLWDVAPDGQQTLITRGVYRLTDNQQGKVGFEMNGNGYCLDAGHVPKLQLVGNDNPRLRPSNGAFSVDVSDVTIDIPTAEDDPTPPLAVTAKPSKVKRGEQTNFRFKVTSREQRCSTSDDDDVPDGQPVEGAKLSFGGKTVTTDGRGNARVETSIGTAGRKNASATLEGFGDGEATVRVTAASNGGNGGSGSGGGSGSDDDSESGTGGDSSFGSGTGTSSSTSTTSSSTVGGLPFTGLELSGLALIGLALVGAGWTLNRRLRAGSDPS